MTDYNVKYTDKNKAPIVIGETTVNNTDTDISLFGRKRLEYGRDMNANFLHILENFASPEDPDNPGNPDPRQLVDGGTVSNIADTTKRLLSTPTEGQLWYNTTQECMFVYTVDGWVALGMVGDIAANWGVIADGGYLPRPVNQQGYTFSYDECAWIVSPFVFDAAFTYMECVTDETGLVTMYYAPEGQSGPPVSGCANYLIVGIKGNVNQGQIYPFPTTTPYPTSTPTPTPTRSATPMVSPTPSVTPTPGVSMTPTPSVTPSPTVTPSITPSASTVNYVVSISASPSGNVLPGSQICYTVSLNHPAPSGGYPITLTRSGDLTGVCASTDGTLVGPMIDQTLVTIPAGQMSAQVCKNAPSVPTPSPTPTATPRTACKLVPGESNPWGATYWHGFMCSNTPGGELVYFTNASGGGGNYYPCTQYTACNDATSFTSVQTIPINPFRENQQRYNATPAVQLQLRIQIPGVGTSATWGRYIYGTTPQTHTSTLSVGDRQFTVTVNMIPTLISSSGNNRTWRVESSYTVVDNETGQTLGFC